jgi:hypothetical protein
MAAFQLFFREYIENKLNEPSGNLLTPNDLKFKLFNRYGIQNQEFFDTIVESVDWENAPVFTPQFEGYTINTDFVGLGALNAAGESVKVPNVLYEFTAGAGFVYYIWDNLNKRYVIVDRNLPPFNTYTVNGDFDRLSALEEAGEVYYRYVWWDKDFNNGPSEPDGKYVEVDITQEPFSGYIINTEFDFLNALISLGVAEQRPLTVYRLLIENILWEVANPFQVSYVEFNTETGSFEFIDQSQTPIFTTFTNKDNVVIEFEGEEYRTQLGQYNLRNIRYIPSIIEDFIGEYQPLDFVKNVSYTIPITFYVNETIDKQLDNVIVEAIQQFQDSIRGKVDTYFDDLAGRDFTFLLTHSGYSPLTGIIDFNGTIFREYQLVISLEMIDKGFFANQIEYTVSVPEYVGVDTADNIFASLANPFRVFPVAAMSSRGAELHQFQKFSTSVQDVFEVKSIANEVGFMVELSFLYDGGLFTRWLYALRYTPTIPKIITLQVRYPGLGSALEIPDSIDYVIESIGGLETVGEKIIISVVLKPADLIQLELPSDPIVIVPTNPGVTTPENGGGTTPPPTNGGGTTPPPEPEPEPEPEPGPTLGEIAVNYGQTIYDSINDENIITPILFFNSPAPSSYKVSLLRNGDVVNEQTDETYTGGADSFFANPIPINEFGNGTYRLNIEGFSETNFAGESSGVILSPSQLIVGIPTGLIIAAPPNEPLELSYIPSNGLVRYSIKLYKNNTLVSSILDNQSGTTRRFFSVDITQFGVGDYFFTVEADSANTFGGAKSQTINAGVS